MLHSQIETAAHVSLLINWAVSGSPVISQMLPLVIDPSVFPRIPKGSMDSIMPTHQFQGRIFLPLSVDPVSNLKKKVFKHIKWHKY